MTELISVTVPVWVVWFFVIWATLGLVHMFMTLYLYYLKWQFKKERLKFLDSQLPEPDES